MSSVLLICPYVLCTYGITIFTCQPRHIVLLAVCLYLCVMRILQAHADTACVGCISGCTESISGYNVLKTSMICHLQVSVHIIVFLRFQIIPKRVRAVFACCPCCKKLAKKYKAEATTAVSSGFTRSTAAVNIKTATTEESTPADNSSGITGSASAAARADVSSWEMNSRV